MNKRYQIFVSSTFEDLKEERQVLLRTILDLNHIPAGMELFPAVDDEAWELIKEVIDESDYYVLVIGGKYGSLSKEGISFTEKEYDYAISKNKRVIAILHKNPDKIQRGKTETDPQAWDKLKEFRKKVENNHTCSYWDGTEDLKSKVIISVTTEIRRHPAIGWVRANELASTEVVNEISRLSSENAELRQKLREITVQLKNDNTNKVEKCIRILKNNKVNLWIMYAGDRKWTNEGNITLYDVFYSLAPELMIESSTKNSSHDLGLEFKQNTKRKMRADWPVPSNHVKTWLSDLVALGLVAASTLKHSVKDNEQYWTLTEWGREVYSTIRKKRLEKGIPTEVPEDNDIESAK